MTAFFTEMLAVTFICIAVVEYVSDIVQVCVFVSFWVTFPSCFSALFIVLCVVTKGVFVGSEGDNIDKAMRERWTVIRELVGV